MFIAELFHEAQFADGVHEIDLDHCIQFVISTNKEK